MAANVPPVQPQPAPQRTSALAIVALVMSCLFFVPLVPLIGAILGIVAVVRIRPGLGGRGLAIAAIPTGFAVFMFTIGIYAAIAIPSFIKYTRRAKEAEAQHQIRAIFVGLKSFHQAEHVGADGMTVRTGVFPIAGSQCDQGGSPSIAERFGERALPAPGAWSAPCWQQIGFDAVDPLYYDYHYRVDGDGGPGTELYVWAEGDLDADTEIAVWYVSGVVSEDGTLQGGTPAIKSTELGGPMMDDVH